MTDLDLRDLKMKVESAKRKYLKSQKKEYLIHMLNSLNQIENLLFMKLIDNKETFSMN